MERSEDRDPFQPRLPPMSEDDPVVRWLLQGDPAIRWQVLRDLLDAPEDEVTTEPGAGRARGLGCATAGAAGS
jgi:hypothetical protein